MKRPLLTAAQRSEIRRAGEKRRALLAERRALRAERLRLWRRLAWIRLSEQDINACLRELPSTDDYVRQTGVNRTTIREIARGAYRPKLRSALDERRAA